MHWQQRRAQFRAQINSDQCVHPASVFDPVSARIAEQLGFEMGMFAGSVASLTVLGDPDHIVLTLSEFADQAYRIGRACNLPIMVDADHGYGNALNVKRTVEELETAGVSGLSIEDTELPTAYSSGGKTRLISVAEGVGKMKAAVAGRQDPELVIAARTSAISVTDVDDAVTRVKAYQQTGVDAVFLVGVKTREQLDAITDICELPLIIGGAGQELMDRDYLATRGVRICLQGHQPIMAAFQAVHDTMKSLREGVAPADLERIPAKDWVAGYTRESDYAQWIAEFLES